MKTVEIKQIAISTITEIEELKAFLPPIDAIADEKLKAEIIEQGIREPLSLAMIDGKAVLLDGHNRLRIVTTTPELKDYKTVPTVFYDHITDLTDAQQFMVNNQLGKRNLGTMERIMMVLKLEPELTAQAKARKQMTATEKEQNSAQPAEKGRVIEKLAEMAKTSRATITQAKTILATEDAELIALAGNEISINKATAYAGLSPEKRKAKIEAVIKKITDKEAETATEEQEEIIIDGLKYTKISEHSYLAKTEHNIGIYGIKKINNKYRDISRIYIVDNQVRIAKMPPLPIGYNAPFILTATGDNEAYDEAINDIQMFLDNIKTAKRYTDPARAIARKAYLDEHPEAKPVKPVKLPTQKQLARIEKKRLENEAKVQKQADKKAQREERARKEELYRRTPSATQQTQLNDRIYKLVNAETLTNRKEDIDKAIYQITQRIYVYKTSADEHRKVAKEIFAEMNIPLAGKAKAKEKTEDGNRVLSPDELANLKRKIEIMPITYKLGDLDEVIVEIQKRINVKKSKIAEIKEVAKTIFKEKGIALKDNKPETPKAPAKKKAPAKTKKPTTPAEPAPAKFETTLGDALKATLPAKTKKAPAKKATKAKAPAKPAKKTIDEETVTRLEEMLLIVKSEDKKAEIVAEIAELKAKIASKKK